MLPLRHHASNSHTCSPLNASLSLLWQHGSAPDPMDYPSTHQLTPLTTNLQNYNWFEIGEAGAVCHAAACDNHPAGAPRALHSSPRLREQEKVPEGGIRSWPMLCNRWVQCNAQLRVLRGHSVTAKQWYLLWNMRRFRSRDTRSSFSIVILNWMPVRSQFSWRKKLLYSSRITLLSGIHDVVHCILNICL